MGAIKKYNFYTQGASSKKSESTKSPDRMSQEDKQLIEGTNYWWAVVRLANTHNFHDVVETFCHEMVHVKQFLRRELTSNGMKWKGQPNPNTDNPFEEPHEVEAYKLEKILYNKCVDLKLI